MKLSYVTRFFSGGHQVRAEGEERVTTAFAAGRNFFRRRRSRSVGASTVHSTTIIQLPPDPNAAAVLASASEEPAPYGATGSVDGAEALADGETVGATGSSEPGSEASSPTRADGESSANALAQPKTMFLIQKYTQYKAAQAEQQKRKVTEKELAQLNHKIDKLLTKLDEHEPEIAVNQDEECVVCVHAKATMQTYPCGHRVVCRKCFVKTIQMAVAQRLLPLRCVICRAKILRLKHSTGGMQPLPSSASQYSIGHHWYNVPQSASLYSVSSNASAASGASSASSCSSASSYKTCASSFSSASFRKAGNGSKIGYKPLRTSSLSPNRETASQQPPRSSLAMAMAKKDNRVAPAETAVPPRGKLTLIQEFRREFIHGKESCQASHRDAKVKLHGVDNHHHGRVK